MSKIQIWKRITTAFNANDDLNALYLICQRYKFESESQLLPLFVDIRIAVFNMSKIQIWKRITTSLGCDLHARLLYLICQRYKFESESQQAHPTFIFDEAVFNMSKIQIWKRITTTHICYTICPRLYLICQRYKFESESQRIVESHANSLCCI